MFVTLAWTAPGDDLTLGRAFRYEIRCFTAKEALSQGNFGEQGILVHSSLVPVPEPRSKEQRCTVSVPWPNEVFYYAIVAFDAVGNRGEVSNMVSVYVEESVTTLAQELGSTKNMNMKDLSATMPIKSSLSESMMYVIAGIISLIMITIIIILPLVIRHLKGCGNKSLPITSLAPSPPSPQHSLPAYKQSPVMDPFSHSSASYISGYNLPEMLGHQLPQGRAQGMTLPHRASLHASPHASLHASLHHSHYTEPLSRRTEQPLSPSASPVNSTHTGGQSTGCSVSVSGSDHELDVGDTTGLQVVAIREVSSDRGRERGQRAENRTWKIPPPVPCKTVHASLV
jgi:hypothetical protein